MDRYVYHYTSLEALSGIINKNLCFWATKYDHLNDPSEQIWAEFQVLESIKRLERYKDDSYQNIKEWLAKESYIISFCKKPDDRNMWRLYCNDGTGVCLVLDRKVLYSLAMKTMEKDPNNYFSIIDDVEYASLKNIDSVVSKCVKKSAFNLVEEERASQLMRVLPFIKNEDFKVEHEVRYALIRENESIQIVWDDETQTAKQGNIQKNLKGVKYRMRGNQLVPYIDIEFPARVLKGIILGYNVENQNATEYIHGIIDPFKDKYKALVIRESTLFSSIDRVNHNKIIALSSNI